MDPNKIVRIVQFKYPAVGDIQQAIAFLKQRGFDRGHSMVIIQRAYGLSPNESKSVVHHSIAWAADRAAVERLHQQFGEALDEEDGEHAL